MQSDAPSFLTPIERLRAMFGVVLVGVLFVAFVGPLVLAPRDPVGCISVSSCRLGWWVIPICAVLSAALAVVVCCTSGAQVEELGVFGVTLGLSLAALRFDNAGYLWATMGQGEDTLRRGVAGIMAAESLGWLLVVVAAYAGSEWIIGRFSLQPKIRTDPRREGRNGALTVLFMSIIAVLLLQILSAGTEVAPVQTGQAYFACAASCYLAALIAYQLTGAQSPVWAYLAVGLVALVGYLWTVFSPTPMHPGRALSHLIHLSPTAFGRALPIHIIMVGTTAAVFGNWHQRQLTHYARVEDARLA